jgi:class 3 adenylate cyclase/tetratricopeptide (TPR) repeat protein
MKTSWLSSVREDLERLAGSAEGPQATVKLRPGERREVAVLFLDLKGYTALAERLDPEDVGIIIGNLHRIFTNEIRSHGGWVEKYIGDALMAVFGAQEAHEDDAVRALRVGLSILEKLDEINNQVLKEGGLTISIRIGVNAGLVATGLRNGELTVVGDVVNVASRLEEAAPPGTILVSEEAKERAGDYFLYEPMGSMAVKNRASPLNVFVVKGPNPDRKEKWERSALLRSSKFVGRRPQMELLRTTYEKARGETQAGPPYIVGVKSPPGIGKSRLIHEFILGLMADGVTKTSLLRGHALPYMADPYWPFVTLLRGYLGATGAEGELPRLQEKFKSLESYIDDAEELVRFRYTLPFISHLVGAQYHGIDLRSLDPQTLRGEIVFSLRFFLQIVARESYAHNYNPLIVQLDDLQWASSSTSLHAIGLISRGLRAFPPPLFLLAYRPECHIPEVLAGVERFHEIELPPLTEEEGTELFGSLLGGERLPREAEEKVIASSMGNPFFLEELVHHLVDDGIIKRDGERWSLARPAGQITIPSTISGIISSRIDKLEKGPRSTLQWASVLGREFSSKVLELVGSKMGRGPNTLSGHLRVLSDEGLIVSKGRGEYAFKHVLIQEVAYSTLLIHNRKVLHKLAAEALEEISSVRPGKHTAALAYHYGETDEVEKAVDYLRRAGEEAARIYANEKAIGYYNRAIERATEGDLPAPVLIELCMKRSQVLGLVGRRDEQKEDIDRMVALSKEHGDRELISDALNLRAEFYRLTTETYVAKKEAEEALSIKTELGDRGGQRKSLSILGLIYRDLGDYRSALSSLNDAVATARELGDKKGEIEALQHIGVIHLRLNDYSSALQVFRLASEASADVKDRDVEGWNLLHIGQVYQLLGAYGPPLENFDLATRIFREIGDRRGEAWSLYFSGLSSLLSGDFKGGLESLGKALSAFQEIGHRRGEGWSLHSIGLVYLDSGRNDEALEYFREAYRVREDLERKSDMVSDLSYQAIAHLGLADVPSALSSSTLAISMLPDVEGQVWLKETIYFNHFRVLRAAGFHAEAQEYLKKAYDLVMETVGRIAEPHLRKSFLERVRSNREIVREWVSGREGNEEKNL